MLWLPSKQPSRGAPNEHGKERDPPVALEARRRLRLEARHSEEVTSMPYLLIPRKYRSSILKSRAWQQRSKNAFGGILTLTDSSPPDAALAAAAAHTTLRGAPLRCARLSAKLARAGAALSHLATTAVPRREGADLQATLFCSINQRVVHLH